MMADDNGHLPVHEAREEGHSRCVGLLKVRGSKGGNHRHIHDMALPDWQVANAC